MTNSTVLTDAELTELARFEAGPRSGVQETEEFVRLRRCGLIYDDSGKYNPTRWCLTTTGREMLKRESDRVERLRKGVTS